MKQIVNFIFFSADCDTHKLNYSADYNPEKVHCRRYGDIFLKVASVGAEEYQYADAAAREQACNHCPGADYPGKVKLCNNHRGGAVGYKPHKGGYGAAEHGNIQKQPAQIIFAHKVNNRIESKRNNKYKSNYTGAVEQGGFEYAALFTVTVIFFTDRMNCQILFFFMQYAEQYINPEADYYCRHGYCGNRSFCPLVRIRL